MSLKDDGELGKIFLKVTDIVPPPMILFISC